MEAVDGLLHARSSNFTLLVPIVVQHHQPADPQHGGAVAEVDHHPERGVGAVHIDQVEPGADLEHLRQLIGGEALGHGEAGEAELVHVPLKAGLDRVVLLFRVQVLVEPGVDHRDVQPARQQPVHEGQVAALIGADLQIGDSLPPFGEAAQHRRHERKVLVGPEVGEFQSQGLHMGVEDLDVAVGAGRGEHGLREGRDKPAVDGRKRAQGIGHGRSFDGRTVLGDPG